MLQLSPLRALADVELISDEPAVLPAASKRSDTHCTCKVSLLCEVWCDSEALTTVKMTSYSTYTETVSLACVCACASASYCES